MIRRLGKIPKKLYLAYSGGLDSSVVLDFLLSGRRDITLLHVNHGTEHGKEAQEFVQSQAKRLGLSLIIRGVAYPPPAGCSKEAYWRDARYEFFHSFGGPVITCHHLDDAIETWIFTALQGKPRLIPYKRSNVIRPFLPTSRNDLKEWAKKNNLDWVEDPSNADTCYARNQIRHNIVPECLKVNPGIHKSIRKQVMAENGV